MKTYAHTQQGQESFLTRHELSHRWKVSIETLKRREHAGVLTALKLGRGVRYRLLEIEKVEAQAEVRY